MKNNNMPEENGGRLEWFGWKPVGDGKTKSTRRTVTYGEECRQQKGKTEESLVEEASILEEGVSPNIRIAEKVACQNVAVKCM